MFTICDADFVLIFQNSNVFNSVYRFVEVVPCAPMVRNDKACIRDAPIQHVLVYEQHNPCNVCINAEDRCTYGLNVGAPCDKGHMYGSVKADWVKRAREGFLFDNNKKYLYCHNGKMGMIDILLETFVPFYWNEGVYTFFYRMMQLDDKPLTSIRFDKWVDHAELNYISEDDDDYDMSDDSDDDDC